MDRNDDHFYVENARLMSYGLSNLGKVSTHIIIDGRESLEELAGKLIGYGISESERKNIDILEYYTRHENPFIRRAAYTGLSLSGLIQFNPGLNNILPRGFMDEDVEVRKCSLIGYGLANLSHGDESTSEELEQYLSDQEWKIRGAAGLAHSTAFIGNPFFFDKFVSLLKSEDSPYVKVCSCWYISTAFADTGKGIDEYAHLLSMLGDENSFFRDMACLGLGFSHLGSQDENVDDLLRWRIAHDTHPYVRESACFGLSLNNFRRPTQTLYDSLSKAFKDDSMIVRSGASLGVGIASMKTGSIGLDVMHQRDHSVRWGLMISEGLAKAPHSIQGMEDAYVRWGYHIGNSFRDDLDINQESRHLGVKMFQQPINQGLIGSGIVSENQKDAFKLFFPGFYYYTVYDSFWWGLWVLSALGNTLLTKNEKY
ncbi:MAG: hypothetical protein COS47_01335 [Candidatus Nealsonbacteria bacterium CG03_land_8_20_14_0_80_36_12]|uniref:HEAT repeat domain-containing protein n=1 Tax=Candidatus Nealsonbacteria bacterium CG03_land_8_20_14_0_80_36_12 TaxID=1974701 RepID=A0A2M7BYA6_9BACT|nr:MAG: hypothetical protein COS47_01335 [Candidatus Nealsonbacteria bacterium CG03_land_8_20_14_0_80_36_12]